MSAHRPVLVSAQLHRRAKAAASERNISMSRLVELACSDILDTSPRSDDAPGGTAREMFSLARPEAGR